MLAPFGRGDTLRKGYVVSLSHTPSFAPEKLKALREVDPGAVSVQEQMICLAWWMKERYGATMNQALKTVMPVKSAVAPKEEKTIVALRSREELSELLREAEKKKYKARIRLYKALLENGELPYRLTAQKLGVTAASLRPLEEKGILKIRTEEKSRDPVKGYALAAAPVVLNEDQKRAAAAVKASMDAGEARTWLLYGITGSGKTEVYMELISHVLDQGRQVIVLIPEISLTYQTVMRFYRRFGNRVSIINSRLSAGERYDQLARAARGDIDIMIGPRSALFTPFERLGLIIIDEEHEGAYQSELSPRYHAREVAAMRASMNQATLVLGSATPSVESFYKAERGEYGLLTLGRRAKKDSRLARVHVVDLREELAEGSATPSVESFYKAERGEYGLLTLGRRAKKDSRLARVHVVDLREELAEGNRSMFSRKLKELMEERLLRKEQIMLFMNRRGYAGFVSCRSCGEAMKCPHCDVSLTYHRDGILRCHYCGHEVRMPRVCPVCGSPYIAPFGSGTQKLEEITKRTFPQARVLRMDADTTAKKGAHEEILEAFMEGEADILIGTQMIVKGHDFPRVTLVGVMAADLSLYAPDFRSSERTFELLTQASGRAGRGELPGDVVIQTYAPDHFAITAAAEQDYGQFYRQEFLYRKMMGYPPAAGLLSIQLSSRKEEAAAAAMEDLQKWIRREFCFEEISVIGPVNGSPYKVNDIYRKILYIKSESYDILLKVRKSAQKREEENEWYKNVNFQAAVQ